MLQAWCVLKEGLEEGSNITCGQREIQRRVLLDNTYVVLSRPHADSSPESINISGSLFTHALQPHSLQIGSNRKVIHFRREYQKPFSLLQIGPHLKVTHSSQTFQLSNALKHL